MYAIMHHNIVYIVIAYIEFIDVIPFPTTENVWLNEVLKMIHAAKDTNSVFEILIKCKK